MPSTWSGACRPLERRDREAEKNPLVSIPGALDQTPEFDPADSEPVPDDDFDQSRTW